MSLENIASKKLVNALVADLGLEFSSDSSVRPTLKRIVMPELKYGVSEKERDAWLSAVLDEAYFRMPNMRKDLTFSQKCEDLSEHMSPIYTEMLRNKAQQHRQGVLTGADEIADKSFADYIQHTDNTPQRDALRLLEAKAREMAGLSTHSYGVTEETISPEAKALYNKAKHLLPDYIDLSKSEQETYETARQITKAIFDEENQDAQQQQAAANQKEKGSGNERGSDSKGGAEGEAEGEESSERATEGSKGQPKRNNSLDGIGQKVVFKPEATGEEISLLSTKYEKLNIDSHLQRELTDAVGNANLRLSHKVANLMRIMSQAKYRGGHKQGRINKRRLATVPHGNERVFRKKEQADILDTAVYLLVDSSGSMSGYNYESATIATIAMSEALTQVHIPHAVCGFTHYYSENVMFRHANFGEFKSKSELIDSMSSIRLSGNSDGEALLEAYEEISRQKQKRKIIIVLSDGQPANGSDPHTLLKKVAKDVENSKRVELYAIGIETTTPKDYYSNVVIIKKSSQLEEALMSLLKKTILN